MKSIRDIYKNTPKFSLVFHQFYTRATHAFHADYMPDSLYYGYIDPFYNNWEMAKHIDNKCFYRVMFPGARQPHLLAYRMNGFWYEADGRMISADQAVEIILDTDSCFIKQAVDSEGGHGITYVACQKSASEEIRNLLQDRTGDIVVQAGLSQSQTLAKINASSVNTIRLLTLLRRDGTVKIYSVVLRMGVKGAKVDNASSGGITVGVEANGRLKSCAYNAKGVKFDVHPTSGVHFDDIIIPNYDEVKNLVVQQAMNFPHFRLVSWDVALNEHDEPVIIEANLKFGEIDFHQLNNGPLFGSDTRIILDEVFDL